MTGPGSFKIGDLVLIIETLKTFVLPFGARTPVETQFRNGFQRGPDLSFLAMLKNKMLVFKVFNFKKYSLQIFLIGFLNLTNQGG